MLNFAHPVWWLATLTAVPGRKSFREVGERGREVGGPDHPQGVFPQNWGETELNRSVTCMVLKATANRRHLALCHDEFRGP
ncbi:cullin-4A [Trichonephila clavipes]|nr:cullin-4A [Trichonephila clavipes]